MEPITATVSKEGPARRESIYVTARLRERGEILSSSKKRRSYCFACFYRQTLNKCVTSGAP
jgi:hypothetical protein